MIPRTIPTWQGKSWQEELSELITDPAVLIEQLELDKSLIPAAEKAAKLFPLRATHAYISRIRKGDPNDPLLKQILPLHEELTEHPEFVLDPLAEAESNAAPGLIHKYKGRVLLIASTQCAIHCRYCFRRHFDYQSNQLTRQQWQETLSYIQNDPSIEEVILSGGDPLSVSDNQLGWLISEIEAIGHISRLRIHTRLPIVAPSRITPELIQRLTSTRLKSIVVLHINHAQEIDDELGYALDLLQQSGITLLNQSVLLKGVNDDAEALISLSKTLCQYDVMPYYLHLLDKVSGTQHFYVPMCLVHSIYNALLANLPGYLVPKLVKETPNAPSKELVI